MIRIFPPLAALSISLLTLTGCGLQPLYSAGSQGNLAQSLAAIDVAKIEGQAGWLMRNALNDRLGLSGSAGGAGGARGAAGAGAQGGAANYRLEVRLDDQLQGLGVLGDDRIGRERRILRARYQLVDLNDGTIVLDATSGSDAGIDVVSSEYATIAAEQYALENLTRDVAARIVNRISLALRERASETAPDSGSDASAGANSGQDSQSRESNLGPSSTNSLNTTQFSRTTPSSPPFSSPPSSPPSPAHPLKLPPSTPPLSSPPLSPSLPNPNNAR